SRPPEFPRPAAPGIPQNPPAEVQPVNAVPDVFPAGTAGSSLAALNAWVAEVAALTRPDAIHWCDGSDAENAALVAGMEADGTLIRLNHETHPGSWLHRSDPDDVARVEHLTFVCTPERDDAGPRPGQDRRAVRRLHAGAHDVRDPVLHGPDRLAAVALRGGDHRQSVRGRQHAHHDPHGRPGPGADRARRHVREGPALHRR